MSQRFVYNAAIMEALKVRGRMDSWNDDRLDELARGTKEGFAKVDARFDKVEGEIKEGFAEVHAANERMYRMLFGAAVVIIAALIGVPALGG
jgi:hypothetical protein